MAVEIERKFLVDVQRVPLEGTVGTRYVQGYLADGEATVRVRIAGSHAYLTIKGRATGIARPEFEYPIPVDDAQAMLASLCMRPLIDKHRHCIEYAGHTWEVDVFHGDNEGLVVAEVELASADEAFVRPDWLGEEVTDDPRYYNARLVANPYSIWGRPTH